MNSTRKADLQRKLAMTSVPKPPAGLAERIKNDIPADLGKGMTMFRREETRRATLGIGIAASVLILFSSIYFAARVAPRRTNPIAPVTAETVDQQVSRAATQPVARTAPATAEQTTNVVAAAPVRQDTMSTQVVQTRNEPARIAASLPAAAPQKKDQADRVDSLSDTAAPVVAERMQTASTAGAAPVTTETTPSFAPAPVPAEALVVTQSAAADGGRAAERKAAISPAEAAATAKTAAAEREVAVNAVVGGVLAPAAQAPLRTLMPGAPAAPAAARTRFGISVDPAAVESVREAIARDELPASVDVAALVSYFAGAPEEAPSEVGINVEGSPPPVAASELARVVRISVDTLIGNGGMRPVATDVRLTITFDDRAVASHRLVGGKDVGFGYEPALYDNTSVTALYDVQLRPHLRDRQSVARVQLHYRDASGRVRTLDRGLNVRDVGRPWVDTSRRHRLACLVAIWGETLKYDTGGADVARRAEELARQEPRDPKARELARLATASSRLQNSGPTGSGR